MPRDLAETRPAPTQEAKRSVLLEQLKKAQDEISKLNDENAGLLTDLEQCKDALFNLQPLGQISDDSAQKEWERILGAIDGLVYDTMVDARDDALHTTWRKLRQDRKKKGATKMIKRREMRVWARFSCANFLILSSIIQWILDKHIFRKAYPLSIEPKEIGFLKDIERGMRQSTHTRG